MAHIKFDEGGYDDPSGGIITAGPVQTGGYGGYGGYGTVGGNQIDYGTGGGYPEYGGGYNYGQNLPKVIGAPDGRTGNSPIVRGPMPRYPDPNSASSLFSQQSTPNDLIAYLNQGGYNPQSAQAIVQQYAAAQGLTGNQGNPNGMNWGDFDASRQKYYVPGSDIRYENGQWVSHPWGSGSGNGGVFDDPATQGYEDLINQLIGKLNTPYQAPGFQPAIDYLQKYFQQLQNPVYTPEQQGLIQTQALDPLSSQRDATRQQIIQRFANQGLSPSSGIVQKAIQDSDQQFEALRTQAQSSFARGEIEQGKQQAAQAAQLGPAIAGLQQQQFGGNEARALQGLNLAGIIPNLAWQRLTGANNLMQQTNPLNALQLLNSFQTQGYNQGANYGNSLANFFAQLAPLFGGLF